MIWWLSCHGRKSFTACATVRVNSCSFYTDVFCGVLVEVEFLRDSFGRIVFIFYWCLQYDTAYDYVSVGAFSIMTQPIWAISLVMHLHNTFRNVHQSRACTNLGPHPHTVKSEKRSVAEQLISVTRVLRAGTLPHICLDHGPHILKNLCCQVAVRNVKQAAA